MREPRGRRPDAWVHALLPAECRVFLLAEEERIGEVDIMATVRGRLVPFEVKYRTRPTGASELPGLAQFRNEQRVDRAYAITRVWEISACCR
jgi:hypothetical protein